MRFINNQIRDAYFAAHRPRTMRFDDAADAAGEKLTDTLTTRQLNLLANYMAVLCSLRQEEQQWYFQRGWLAAEKAGKRGNTP